MQGSLQEKHELLKERLGGYGKVAVAFSAGVDSTLLLAVAHEVLGDGATALTAVSPANPEREVASARAFCDERGIRQVLFDVDELAIEGFEHNPPERCYLCKRQLFSAMQQRAAELGLGVVVEGSNVDDLGDYRPGKRALGELSVASPLLECGFTKREIRDLSKQLGLPTWDKPSFACLYTRFAYGDLITPEKLERVAEAEQWLLDRGFSAVRVRLANSLGDAARIEVGLPDVARACADPLRVELVDAFDKLGFASIALDLRGYRTGSMNDSVA